MAPQRPRRTGNPPHSRPKPGANDRSNKPGPGQDRKGPGARRPPTQAARRPAGSSKATASKPAEISGAERLQKILAHAGVGSRRACEELILQGRVTAGGQVIRELGTKVDPTRTPVAVDGQKVQLERPVYFAVYKPKGYVSTNNDPSGRPRVLDLLPEIPQRVYTVGRLDEMSVGLMLLTNDGELANKLAHPKFGVEKLYRVVVAGSPPREVLNQLVEGIWLAEGKVRAKSVRAVGKRGDSTILELVLAEGKNREVRRMLAKLGHKVMTLTRVAVGPITIKGLTAGQFRPLTGREVDLLRRVADGQPVPMPWMDRKPRREPEKPRRPEGPRNQSNQAGGPPRHSEGPRPGPGSMPRRPAGPGMTPHPGVPPSERPRPGRGQGAVPPSGYAPPPRRDRRDGPPPRPDGPRAYREDGPRPQQGRPGGYGQGQRPQQGRPGGYGQGQRPQQGRPGGYGQGQRPQHQADGPRPGGPRRSFDDGPRPPRVEGEGRRPNGAGHGQDRRQNNGPPRPPGPRIHREDGPRDGYRPGPRPNGPSAPPGGRRPGPPPGQDQPRRRVIGLEVPPPAPRPTPVAEPTPDRDDRPKPRMKRPTGKRPAPRPAGGARPMPKPRKGARRGED